MDAINQQGLVLVGAGKMGGAMLAGWLARGVQPTAVTVLDPNPSDWLMQTGVSVNAALPAQPAVVVLAVKPQMMGNALPGLAAMGNAQTLFVSIAAGTTLAALADALGDTTPIVRAMPNTPAAISQGISALVGNASAAPVHLDMAETLLSAVGPCIRLSDEALIDAVTALSGSGPAYVFHMIEAMAQAGAALGLPDDLAMQLARQTVIGSGALAAASRSDAAQLRRDVTSPGGTTEAALRVLMDDATGLPPLMARAMTAAHARAQELGK
jgi:pyrroline-5-carboxylate reductase